MVHDTRIICSVRLIVLHVSVAADGHLQLNGCMQTKSRFGKLLLFHFDILYKVKPSILGVFEKTHTHSQSQLWLKMLRPAQFHFCSTSTGPFYQESNIIEVIGQLNAATMNSSVSLCCSSYRAGKGWGRRRAGRTGSLCPRPRACRQKGPGCCPAPSSSAPRASAGSAGARGLSSCLWSTG